LPASTSPFDALNLPLAMPVNVDLPLAVGIPADYIPDQELRLRLYRRIADLRDESEIDALLSEFNDRFGPLPEMVQNLFYQMRVKLRAEEIGLASISMENGQILLRYPNVLNGESAPRLRDLGPGVRAGKNAYWLTFGREPDWPERLLDMLERVGVMQPSMGRA
jgi:transcription-repair coupling factor (superfamily II helicase)